MTTRLCLDCRTPTTAGSRCPRCARTRARTHDAQRGNAHQRGYTRQWRQLSTQIRETWILEHGHVCPGYQRGPHLARDLTVDHRIPLRAGGTSTRDNAAVLCRACNNTKRTDDLRRWPTQETPR